MRILVDEMYPASLAEALHAIDIEATTVAALRLAGASDPQVFGAAVAGGYAILTENVADFARIAAEHSTAGGHHRGVLGDACVNRQDPVGKALFEFLQPGVVVATCSGSGPGLAYGKRFGRVIRASVAPSCLPVGEDQRACRSERDRVGVRVSAA